MLENCDRNCGGLSYDGNGLVWEHIDELESDQLYEEIFVNRSYLKCGVELSEGSIVFDIGANIGLFSLFCLDILNANVTIVAIEPIKPIFDVLQRNVLKFKRNFILLNVACGVRDNLHGINFTYYKNSPGESTSRVCERAGQRNILQSNFHQISEDISRIDAETYRNAIYDHINKEDEDCAEYKCPVFSLETLIQEHHFERIDLLKVC